MFKNVKVTLRNIHAYDDQTIIELDGQREVWFTNVLIKADV